MADLRPQYNDEAVGANHPTKADVINRAWNVEHAEDGTHAAITATSITGPITVVADHGAAATDQAINVCYGVGAPPAANTTTIGSLFIKYIA